MFQLLKKLYIKLYWIFHRIVSNSEYYWFVCNNWLHYRIHEVKFKLNNSFSQNNKQETLRRSHQMCEDLLHALNEKKFSVAQILKLTTLEQSVLCDVLMVCQQRMNEVITNEYSNKFGPYYAVGHTFPRLEFPDYYEQILTRVLYQLDTSQKIESSIDVRKKSTESALELLFMAFRIKPNKKIYKTYSTLPHHPILQCIIMKKTIRLDILAKATEKIKSL